MLMLARRSSRYALFVLVTLCAVPAFGTTLEQAKRIYDRLTGTPVVDATMLNNMKTLLDGGDGVGAALLAIDDPNTAVFYNATLKNWAAPWTNRDDDKFAPLNDYVATIIGVVRDEHDYRRIL